MKTLLLTLSFFFMLLSGVSAQVVNIENRRIPSDTTGIFGSLGLSINLINNQKQVLSLGNNAHVQLKTKKDLYLVLQSLSWLRADNQDLVKRGFWHVRYNRKTSPILRLEAFGQIQFNSIEKVENRILAGAGPRFKLSKNEKYKAYLGTLIMHEWERLTRPAEQASEQQWDHQHYRFSSYISISIYPTKTFSLTSTTYFQPRLEYISDYPRFQL